METPQNLEQLIQRELAKLPERQAPETLIPRVMAQIRAQSKKRWWQRPWTHWALPLQFASVLLMFTGVLGAVAGIARVGDVVMARSSLEGASNWLDSLSAVWDFGLVMGNAVLVMARAAGTQWLLLALLVPLAMYLACVGLGTLCYRMAYYNR